MQHLFFKALTNPFYYVFFNDIMALVILKRLSLGGIYYEIWLF